MIIMKRKSGELTKGQFVGTHYIRKLLVRKLPLVFKLLFLFIPSSAFGFSLVHSLVESLFFHNGISINLCYRCLK